ncbi:MAG: hypothetical protein ACFFBD_29580 [Candidatus Hodarchaeota archaeon]
MAFNILQILIVFGVGSFSLLIALFIFQKSPKNRLNQLFALGYCFFGLFLLITLPWQILPVTDTTTYAVLFNLCRDISSMAAISSTATLFLVSQYARRGPELFENRPLIISFVVGIIGMMIIGQLDDHIVLDPQSYQGFYLVDGPLGLLFCFILPLVLSLGMVINFGLLWYNLEDAQIKRNVFFYFIGVTIMVAGQLFQALLIILFDPEFYIVNPILNYIVYFSWAIGELISAVGFMHKN